MPALIEIIEVRNRVVPDDLLRLKPLRSRFKTIVAAYAETINDGRLEAWPAFFTEDCRYLVQARENALVS